MANDNGTQILDDLQQVAIERERRSADPQLAARVERLKAYQQRRFSHTHADLLIDPRYRAASRFFLDHLYGPADFSSRDQQFARVVPALVRLFPADVVSTVADLAHLHAISEQLDSAMAAQLPPDVISPAIYSAAWQATGRRDKRERQVELSLEIGRDLDRLTRKPILRHSLRLMRGPAQAAGLGDLQDFLEQGFEAFRAMRGASEFLALIDGRERALISRLSDEDMALGSASLDGLLPDA